MCQMHPNSDVQLWNQFLIIDSDSTHQNLSSLSLPLFFFNYNEFWTGWPGIGVSVTQRHCVFNPITWFVKSRTTKSIPSLYWGKWKINMYTWQVSLVAKLWLIEKNENAISLQIWIPPQLEISQIKWDNSQNSTQKMKT